MQWDWLPSGSASDAISLLVVGVGKMIRCLRSSELDGWSDE